MTPVKQKRVVVYLPEDEHRRLRSKLASLGKTVSGWFREVVKALLED